KTLRELSLRGINKYPGERLILEKAVIRDEAFLSLFKEFSLTSLDLSHTWIKVNKRTLMALQTDDFPKTVQTLNLQETNLVFDMEYVQDTGKPLGEVLRDFPLTTLHLPRFGWDYFFTSC